LVTNFPAEVIPAPALAARRLYARPSFAIYWWEYRAAHVPREGEGSQAKEVLVTVKYTKELLETVARECVSIAGVMRKLGLAEAGGTHAHLSRRIRQYGIDTSHFLGRRANSGPQHKGRQRLSWQEVLVLRTHGRRQHAHVLRRALLEFGRDYRCEGPRCPVKESWCGQPIMLHVDHQNGNWLDDRPENVHFLCPNCHSQTPNYCGSKGRSEVARRHPKPSRIGPVAE
jgi:hypothetical protein